MSLWGASGRCVQSSRATWVSGAPQRVVSMTPSPPPTPQTQWVTTTRANPLSLLLYVDTKSASNVCLFLYLCRCCSGAQLV